MNRQALAGLKVLDFSRVIAGPLLTEHLALHGATVIRIESTRSLDILRVSLPYKDNKQGINRSGYFSWYNANKYSLRLNLRKSKAKDVIKRLVSWCDVAIENFTPGTIGQLGFSYADIRQIKEDVIMLSTSNQGQTGPRAMSTGYGFTLSALCGLTHLTGWEDRIPAQPLGAITDFLAPYMGVIAVLGALEYRHRTGKGQYIDLSQYECGVYMMSPVMLQYAVRGEEAIRKGNRSDHAAPHGAYLCQGDDRWCVIAINTDDEWQSLCTIMDRPDLAFNHKFSTLSERKMNEDDLDLVISEWTRARTAEEITTTLQRHGIESGIVKNPSELFNDEQLQHRHHYPVMKHPEIGKHHYELPAYRLSLTPGQLSKPAPCLGEHTEYVLRDILNISQAELGELYADGAID